MLPELGLGRQTTSTSAARPAPRLTEEQEAALLRSVRNVGDRLLLRVLLDLDAGGDLGAYPGHQLLGIRTGWEPKTVRNRLSRLRRAGLIVSRRGGSEGLMRYYVMPPASRETETRAPESDVPKDRDLGLAHAPAPRDANNVPAEVPTERDATPTDVPADVPGGVPTAGISSRRGSNSKKTTTGANPPEGDGRKQTPAQQLVNRIITVGLRGQRPAEYGKHCRRAEQLLQHHPLENLLAVVEAMPQEFPFNRGETFDVFDVGKRADKVLAKLRAPDKMPMSTIGFDDADFFRGNGSGACS